MDGLTEIEKLFLNVSEVSTKCEDETALYSEETLKAEDDNFSINTDSSKTEEQEWGAESFSCVEIPEDVKPILCPMHGSGFALSTLHHDHTYHKDFQNVSKNFVKQMELKVERQEECHQSTCSGRQTLKCNLEGNFKIEPETVKIEIYVTKKEIGPNHDHMTPDEDVKDFQNVSETLEVKFEQAEEGNQSTSSRCQTLKRDHEGDFKIKPEMERFEIDVTEKEIKVVNKECMLCDKKFICLASLEDYVTETGTGSVKCAECSGDFPSKSEALLHSYQQHFGGIVIQTHKDMFYSCPICSYNHTYKTVAFSHMGKHEDLIVKCPREKCGWMFPDDARLKDHDVKYHLRSKRSKAHKTNLEKKYVCPTCFISATTKDFEAKYPSLKKLKYKCSKCSESFCSNIGRANHIRLVHQERSPPDFPTDRHFAANASDSRSQQEHLQCEKCDKQFRSRKQAEQHYCVSNGEIRLCKYCPRNFRSATKLEAHVMEHKNGGFSYNCTMPNCRWQFKSYVQLCSHARSIHAQLPQCPICCRQLDKRQEYDSHILTCDEPFRCMNCSSTFTSKGDLVIHNGDCPEVGQDDKSCEKANDAKKEEDPDPNVLQLCSACGENFNRLENVNDYVVHYYDVFQCLECQLEFKSKYELLCHAYFGHTGCVMVCPKKCAKSFKCFLCGRRMREKADLEEHIRHHEQLEFRCSWGGCCFRFSHLYGLQKHQNNEHRSRKKPKVQMEEVVCPKCLANTKLCVTNTKRSHCSPGRYKCSQCTERFTNKLQRHLHMESVHKFTCGKCGMAFRNEQILHLHMESGHVWTCYKCGIEFRNELSLDVHVKKEHLTKKIYPQIQCEICDEGFYSLTSLKVHMKSHSEDLLDNLPTADTPSMSDVQPKISEFNKTAEHFSTKSDELC